MDYYTATVTYHLFTLTEFDEILARVQQVDHISNIVSDRPTKVITLDIDTRNY